MATTWWLSSSESATDVKELIPEFFYFPEFLTNAERESKGNSPSYTLFIALYIFKVLILE